MTQTLDVPLAVPPDAALPGASAPAGPMGPAGGAAEPRRGLAARLAAETGYAVSALPLAVVTFTLVLAGVVVGVSLSWLVVGLPVLAGAVLLARGLAHVERVRMRTALSRRAPSPTYARAREDAGWLRRVLTVLRDPQSWLDVTWALVSSVTAVALAAVTVGWWAATIGGLTYGFWQRWLPDTEGDTLAELLGMGAGRGPEIVLTTVLGVVALLLLPWVVRIAVAAHAGLAEVLLSSRASLQAEVRRATGGRDAARDAEARSLRRLERDIHDGPQQRLVRLAMDLGRARHQLDQDPERARDALDAAYQQARDAIDELRALSRGIAPPLLMDRGLGPALEELVARAEEHVDLVVEPALAHGLPPHVETAVYFVVAEQMTNVAKHSGAGVVAVDVLTVPTADGEAVRVQVADDGVGGAHLGKGSCLAGLEQRVRGLGGTLVLDSPAGGPTILRVEVPLRG
ncbi:sensor domain-containing protein [Nocardioides sp. ChNu-153]|uniref:sensor histidine kinase n=1 Tax=unclassified Nocardioides TaxID=2615069 RepID=UPI0024055901|nr:MULTISPECIES: sensor domain-containing protein [unclassified Nocardioides]MDF9715744.1 sensor domain-containing protein [Nocardioides sp. ChNu-99]MDN7121849.1 sensor domain-containing protein [Nocardioides sp. ChNu-153]